jgi:hypothetical protein
MTTKRKMARTRTKIPGSLTSLNRKTAESEPRDYTGERILDALLAAGNYFERDTLDVGRLVADVRALQKAMSESAPALLASSV